MSNIQIDANNRITIKGAREHNLKNVNLVLPRNKLIVMTGLSGSGKSSLAFDTIFADGQRRYMESLSSYARMFLGQMEKPDVDEITGLSPAISIDQKTTSKNPRSTVGTVTEIYDYLRLLYARAGEAYSYLSGEKMVKYTEEQILDLILKDYKGKRIYILAPLVRSRKGHYKELFEQVKKSAASKGQVPEHKFDSSIEDVLGHIENNLPASVPANKRRYYAVKLFERDADACKLINLTKEKAARVEQLVAQCEQDCDDDAESIITGERYGVIAHIIDECLTPDSSRFWPADQYNVGVSPPSYDKQFIRDWLEAQPWDKTPPAPKVPDEVIEKTSDKYREALRRLAETDIEQ